MKIFFIVGLLIQFYLTGTIMAAPMGSSVGVVEGKIISWVYREKINYLRSDQRGLVEYEVPSHYIVIISIINTSDKEALNFSNNIARSMSFTDRVITDIEDDHRCLYIKAEKINPLLIEGAQIKITDYKISEFIGSVDTSYKSLTITPEVKEK
jgi:hypothetical protein